MKYNSRKLKIKKNLKYVMTFIIQLRDMQDIKELQLLVKVI
jgi:hypothetical protein